jgi:hypothetical protein
MRMTYLLRSRLRPVTPASFHLDVERPTLSLGGLTFAGKRVVFVQEPLKKLIRFGQEKKHAEQTSHPRPYSGPSRY